MKHLITAIIFVFTLMFSSSSHAEWTAVGINTDGDTYYVDFDRIRKHDGFVYFWRLTDLLKPDEDGDWSYKAYNQGDCTLFRIQRLSVAFHKEPMGRGFAKPITVQEEWHYPPPNSSVENYLKSVCSR